MPTAVAATFIVVIVAATVAKVSEIYIASFGRSFVYHIIAVDFGLSASHTSAAGGGRGPASTIFLCSLELGGCIAGGCVVVTLGV